MLQPSCSAVRWPAYCTQSEGPAYGARRFTSPTGLCQISARARQQRSRFCWGSCCRGRVHLRAPCTPTGQRFVRWVLLHATLTCQQLLKPVPSRPWASHLSAPLSPRLVSRWPSSASKGSWASKRSECGWRIGACCEAAHAHIVSLVMSTTNNTAEAKLGWNWHWARPGDAFEIDYLFRVARGSCCAGACGPLPVAVADALQSSQSVV